MYEQFEEKDDIVCEDQENKYAALWETLKTSFAEFLLLPSIIILLFLLLAFVAHLLDGADILALRGFKSFMEHMMFVDNKGTSSLLGVAAAGAMTISTFTISLLLIVVQQSATALSSQVLDRFLRSRSNQTYFGFFLGLSFFLLLELATVNDSFNPVIGATLAFVFTMFALFLLMVLVYTTINQMRSGVVIESIYSHIIHAEKSLSRLTEITRRHSRFGGSVCVGVRVRRHGYVIAIDANRLAEGMKEIAGEVEVELLVSMGSYVPFDYKIALIRAFDRESAKKVAKLLCTAVRIARQRDITQDPAYGIGQLENIGWTAISTAKSKPSTGAQIIRALGNVLLYRGRDDQKPATQVLPIVYHDTVQAKLFDALENLVVVSSESLQHQSYYRILNTLGLAYSKLNQQGQERIENIILTALSVLDKHTLTANLDQTLGNMCNLMKTNNRLGMADTIQQVHDKVKKAQGKL